ncbi:osmoprotectant update ABC transporter permease/substrate-binding subunit OpuFB [Sporosarcina saromensis]|uniref:Osmoprotectant update ABC transporter permease/substrate-binding subunit OpuFB n=1 Tax=Sporosarcina saromensis TaxID=359365 RepID=A0ABU4GDJ9_9BACL|nr:osmoprotectant update ABC transporter permease/substrate-binding subunit OpuFB [Sporosarcina saromensis]MDW0114452.1 osmoprotectant update ABC transporter permease/substrate-binding subunit OpuFB [Sporosarcina saromensis]
MNTLITVFQDRKEDLLTAFIEHIQISLIALFFAVLLSIPIGIYLTHKERIAEAVIGASAVLQTIPSLALLGLLIPLFGIGKVPAIIALVAYALLPILRNTYTGIKEVDPSLKEAATAMGMNQWKRLVKVELPLASPVIMAGIRTSMVLIVGTTTLAALIGAGGLGDLILLGIDRNNTSLIVLGAVPAALLALAFDFLLKKFEGMSFKRVAVAVATFSAAALLILLFPLLSGKSNNHLVIGAKLGAEPEILINMYKLLIEEESDLTVELKPGLGKTSFVFNALQSKSIDIYPEFTGTAIAEFLKEEAVSNDRKEVYEQARSGLEDQFNLRLLEPMEFNNTYTLAVSKAFLEQYGVTSISDLQAVQNAVKAGFTLEFNDREDGYRGIKKLYGLDFPSIQTMEPKLRYQAIETGAINVMDAYSTDSELQEYEMVVLEDDKELFPPYQGAPLLRKDTLEQHPELEGILNKLAGVVTDDEMREMNYKVNVEGASAEEVARKFLQAKGLIK